MYARCSHARHDHGAHRAARAQRSADPTSRRPASTPARSRSSQHAVAGRLAVHVAAPRQRTRRPADGSRAAVTTLGARARLLACVAHRAARPPLSSTRRPARCRTHCATAFAGAARRAARLGDLRAMRRSCAAPARSARRAGRRAGAARRRPCAGVARHARACAAAAPRHRTLAACRRSCSSRPTSLRTLRIAERPRSRLPRWLDRRAASDPAASSAGGPAGRFGSAPGIQPYSRGRAATPVRIDQ